MARGSRPSPSAPPAPHSGEALLSAGNDTRLHIAGTLSLDHWQGREEVQLRAIDAALPPAR